MTFKDYKFSRHLTVDRQERLEVMESIIGFGYIVEEVVSPRDNRLMLFSNTGLVAVLGRDKQTIITMFVIKYQKATALFKGAIPNNIYHAIQYNITNLTDAEKIKLGLDR